MLSVVVAVGAVVVVVVVLCVCACVSAHMCVCVCVWSVFVCLIERIHLACAHFIPQTKPLRQNMPPQNFTRSKISVRSLF